MLVAYVTRYDAHDVSAWSGAGHFIPKALQRAGADLCYVGCLARRQRQALRLKQIALRRIGVRRVCDREPALIRAYAREIRQRLPSDSEVILAAGTLPIAALETDKPLVFWTDATFAAMLDYYPEFTGLPPDAIAQGHRVEHAALERCALAIYTSEWAAASAIRDYGAPPAKVHVVPFGANTAVGCTPAEIDDAISVRQRTSCNLLFIGTDWERKGGDFAVRVVTALQRRGVEAVLHVVGCRAPRNVPGCVRVHGFLSRRDPVAAARLAVLFREARFLLLPTRAECNANVFAEACSYGVPILATRTGGVATSVVDGVNGRTYAPSAFPGEYADYIEDLLADAVAYRCLASRAYEEYCTRLNWDVAGAAVMRLIRERVARKAQLAGATTGLASRADVCPA